MSSTNKVNGFLIALIAGCLGLLAFFALPFVSVGGVGATALSIATGGAQVVGSLAILWIEPLLAGAVALIAGLQFSSSATMAKKKKAGGRLLALGIVGTTLCILFIALLSSVSFIGGALLSALGIGFWAFLIAMIGTIVGAVMARKSVAAQGGVAVPPQYPQYQQPPSPQYPQYQQPSSPQYPQYQQPSSPQYPQYQQPSSPQFPPAQGSNQGQQWPPKQ